VPSITIRKAEPRDIEFLVRGNASMALETEHLSLDIDRLREGVAALFEDPRRGFYFIAEIEGRRAGQMMITFEWSDWRNGTFWWIQSVWVEPALRGQGVFRSLYRHVDELARQGGSVCGLRLYVEEDNERAQATYAKCGMKPTTYQMWEDDFVLKRV
jgi:GNAT superfamily N-acetyltransferase